MELLTPTESPTAYLRGFEKKRGETGRPQELHDEPQRIAQMLGRQNASYDHVWEATERVYPLWQPVHCNSYRRALLLASSAVQHRSKAFEVFRRGRLVCLRLIPEVEETVTRHEATA